MGIVTAGPQKSSVCLHYHCPGLTRVWLKAEKQAEKQEPTPNYISSLQPTWKILLVCKVLQMQWDAGLGSVDTRLPSTPQLGRRKYSSTRTRSMLGKRKATSHRHPRTTSDAAVKEPPDTELDRTFHHKMYNCRRSPQQEVLHTRIPVTRDTKFHRSRPISRLVLYLIPLCAVPTDRYIPYCWTQGQGVAL